MSTIEYHLTYSIITGEFYNNHNKCGRGGGVNDVAGSVYNNGRRMIKIDGVVYQASRLAWKVVYGVDPEHDIDHIDNDRDNNAIHNLRDVTHDINQLNRMDTKRNGGQKYYRDEQGKRRLTELGRISNRERQRKFQEKQRRIKDAHKVNSRQDN